jgi:hypothetical protein
VRREINDIWQPSQDGDLVCEALQMMDDRRASSAHEAARHLAVKAPGGGTAVSKHTRLSKKIRHAIRKHRSLLNPPSGIPK